ncbi:MAG: M67 family metallopeptidase [Bacteroidota bacterium]
MHKYDLDIHESALKAMADDAVEAYNDECCGFFYGSEEQGKRIIKQAIPVTNSKEGDKRRRFEISPLDYMKAEQFAIEHNTTLLGVYHSHPDHPAKPSEHDLKQAVPFFSYIIISVMKGNIADTSSWQLNEQGQFEQEMILNKDILSTNYS